MIRVLQVIGAMDRAGAETMIMNYYRNMDRTQIQFDFLVHTEHRCDYDGEIESLGGNIYHIPHYTGLNHFLYQRACKQFFESHPEISLVHGHIGSGAAVYLSEAKKAGLHTIAHAHSENFYTGLNKVAFSLVTKPIKNKADSFFACSAKACFDTFGKQVFQNKDYLVINNAIDVERYQRALTYRGTYRDRLGLTNKPTLGHIGRFIEVKNQIFLIEVFSNIVRHIPEAQLLLIGDGPLKKTLEKRIQDLDLLHNVHILGKREDIPELLAAMDLFVFPSLKEGLPVSVIEAQASGLPMLLSDGITAEAAVLPTCKRLPLSIGSENWSKEALSLLADTPNRKNAFTLLNGAGFDITQNAHQLAAFYEKHARKAS